MTYLECSPSDQNDGEIKSPVGSAEKLKILLQRSARYSYRQRCCRCCPIVIGELIIPVLIIIIIWLSRYKYNIFIEKFHKQPLNQTSLDGPSMCSLNLMSPLFSSKAMFTTCFRLPSGYVQNSRTFDIEMILQPISNDTLTLAEQARQKLIKMGCLHVQIRCMNQHPDEEQRLLRNNSIIIDFGQQSNLIRSRKISYNLIVSEREKLIEYDPVDTSFLPDTHPLLLSDRSWTSDQMKSDGWTFPAFSDVKIFIDSLLIEYRTNSTIDYEIERKTMTCTPIHQDYRHVSGRFLQNLIFLLVNLIFLYPYLTLLDRLISEKNGKVDEILKLLGIDPIFNHFSHQLRTMILYVILLVSLCIIFQSKFAAKSVWSICSFHVLLISNIIIALQMVAFCTMKSHFFNVKIRGMIGTSILYVLSGYVHEWSAKQSVGIQYIFIFISPFVACRSVYSQIILHNYAQKELNWFAAIYPGVPTYFSTLFVMFLSTLCCWFLSWYFEKVIPGQYGRSIEWNFLFRREYWRRRKQDGRGRYTSIKSSATNRFNSVEKPMISVDQLVKKFGSDKIAVNNVSFDLYANQITSLLGPNGSGKTTIFNCLTGIYRPTSGSISMTTDDGVDHHTKYEMEMLKKSIGYCPQEDLLFDLLTVKEQLEFYAVARGFGKDKQKIVEKMLSVTDLEESKNKYCQNLSGGMKRRLSLACAFVGDTKMILLDEPSSGLDPSNRRSLWDWLRKMKEGKTLLLTTHFMEESEALSDRIIMITDGVIRAEGTPEKLKEQFGSGYKLIVGKQDPVTSEDIEKELRQYLPEMTIETDLSDVGDVIFRTKQSVDDQFVEALHHLELMKTKNQIKSYGVQNSSLEDVFRKLIDSTAKKNRSVDDRRLDDQCRIIFENPQFYSGFSYYLSQIYGLLMKTCLIRRRRWIFLVLILLVPILYNVSSHLLFQTPIKAGRFKMQIDDLNPQTIVYQTDPKMEKFFLSAIESKTNGIVREQRSENISEINRYIWQKRMDQLSTYLKIYLAFRIPEPQNDSFKIQTLSSHLVSGYELISVASNTLFKYKLNDTSASIDTTLIYQKIYDDFFKRSWSSAFRQADVISCYFKALPISLSIDVFVFYLIFFYISVFLINERKDAFYSLLNISGLHPILYWLFNYFVDIFICILWFSYSLFIYYISEMIFKDSSSKQIQNDLHEDIALNSPWNLRIQFYPLTILIVLPMLPFVYLLTKIFKNDTRGGLMISSLLILIHSIGFLTSIINIFSSNGTLQSSFYWPFNLLFPTLNAQSIITYIMSEKSERCQLMKTRGFILPKFFSKKPIGDETMMINVIILIGHVLLGFLLLIAIDCRLFRRFSSYLLSKCRKKQTSFETNLDADVLDERHRIFNSESNDRSKHVSSNQRNHIEVHDLVKYFHGKRKAAVNHLTFGTKPGETFGFLGYNGAGKTTTFRILVGDEGATRGKIYIDGREVTNRFRSLRHLGYCPQTNCNMDFLTVDNSLQLMARIRGIKQDRISNLVQTITSLFILESFSNNYIHQLSGGTKRRLHAALALIGPPRLIILDEPTTGVDPTTRQQMQRIFLNAMKAKLSLIFTSHSMDECERLCNRLGILIDGQFVCLGTIQHLKSKFSQGYTVEIKLRSNIQGSPKTKMQEIKQFLCSQGPFDVEIRESSDSVGLFQIVWTKPADIFAFFEHYKEKLNIEKYIVSQTSLEKIFLSFGKKSS